MVAVRESPHAKVLPDKNTTQWPPMSPFQALLSSPSGRKRWQGHGHRDDDRSPSPSLIRRPLSSSKSLQALSLPFDRADMDEDEDEDEEALRLELREIEIKKKLARLAKAKRSESNDEGKEKSVRSGSRLDTRSSSPHKSLKASHSNPQLRRNNVEVSLSPAKDNLLQPQERLSPARKRLGLKSLAKAQEVSLKRARDGTQLPQNHSRQSTGPSQDNVGLPKPKSFNDRLKASKVEAEDRQARQSRIEKSRSNGFGSRTTDFREPAGPAQTTTRVSTYGDSERKRPSSAHESSHPTRTKQETTMSRSASTRPSRSGHRQTVKADGRLSGRKAVHNDSCINNADEDSSSSFETFSELHLSKRHIPHIDVARALENTEIYTVPRLLKEVRAPDYDPPDVEGDFVMLAILASKSSPFDQKAVHRTSDESKPQEDAQAPRNKFMVFHLCDLKWEVDCFLFGTGFDQFWKLTPGTLIAILNPAIMPPKTNRHSGRFSLKLGSCEDKIMEIGIARDLGYCISVKKDGQPCGAWLDKRSTEICEFHVNLLVEKQRKHRMEVNGMFRGLRSDQDSRIKTRSREEGGWDKHLRKGNGTYHQEYGQLYTVNTGMGTSTATLLDAEDTDALHDMTRAEASRKRIAAAQKERDLRKKLGEIGNSVGAEYLRATDGSSNTSAIRSADIAAAEARALFEKPKASDLGLLNNKASEAHLSPAKDRKRHFGLGAVSSAGSEALGWGGARKAGLLQPRDSKLDSPEKGQRKLDEIISSERGVRPGIVRERSREGSLSPKKRARFQLEKGIREPGRESLGQDLKKLGHEDAHDDDDDGLDIV